jgi:hypothetical protein
MEQIQIRQKPKWMVVLEVLRYGIPVKLIDRDVAMDEEGNLYCYVEQYDFVDKEWSKKPIYLNDITWETLVKRSDELSEEYINGLLMSLALTKVQREKARKRGNSQGG